MCRREGATAPRLVEGLPVRPACARVWRPLLELHTDRRVRDGMACLRCHATWSVDGGCEWPSHRQRPRQQEPAMSHRPSPAAGPTRRRILRVGMTGLGAAALTGLGNSITTRPTAAAAESRCTSWGSGCLVGATPPPRRRLWPDVRPAWLCSRQSATASGAARHRRARWPARRARRSVRSARRPRDVDQRPGLNVVHRSNPHDTAGMTFFSQFIDHDLSFDVTSRLGVATDPTPDRTHGRPASTWIRSTAGAR